MLYEDQAAGFDQRAALDPQTGDAVARALADLAAPGPGDTWLEIGAGTGMLSIPILDLGVRYIGFDQSPAMLERFRERAAGAGRAAELLVADGNHRWPVPDHGVGLIFSSRALHHIDPDHAVAETSRVTCREGGWLVLGRVRRPQDSVKSAMRRRMRELLESQGHAGRSHERGVEAVFAGLENLGWQRAPARTAAHWTRSHAPAESLASWEGKEGLAGIDIPQAVKDRVLGDLRAWAMTRYGDIERPLDQEEWFELLPIGIGAA